MNADPRRKIDILYADVLGEVSDLLARAEVLGNSIQESRQAIEASISGVGHQIASDSADRMQQCVENLQTQLGPALQSIKDETREVVSEINAAARQQVEAVEAVAGSSILEIHSEIDAAKHTAADLLESVAAANKNVNYARWMTLAGAVSLALFSIGFASGHYVSATAEESRQVKSGQILVGAEGQAAMRLAELGEAKNLLDCRVEGWTEKDGFCYGTPRGGKTLGWRIK